MGCAQSKIDNEESVARCKERRNLMKEAVVARNAFAAAHSAYSVSLKNTGAALSDYGHDEAQATTLLQDDDKEDPQPLDSTTSLPPPPPLDSLLPPPPPLPDFSPSPVKRSVSLPSNVMKVRKNRLNVDDVTIVEDDEEEEEDVKELEPRGKMSKEVKKSGKQGGGDGGGEIAATVNLNLSPRTPEARPMQNMAWDYFFNVDHHQHHLGETSLAIEEEEEEEEEETTNINNVEHETVTVNSNVNVNVNHNNSDSVKNGDAVKNSNVTDEPKRVVVEEVEEVRSAPPIYTRRSSAATTSSTNLMQVLNQIDDHFLKASQTAQEVSNLLETTRMHYHSNFADNRGKILSILVAFAVFLDGLLK